MEKIDEMLMDFRDEIIYERMSRGVFQSELAERCGIGMSVGQISRMERGATVPRLDTLLLYMAGLGCRLEIVSDDP